MQRSAALIFAAAVAVSGAACSDGGKKDTPSNVTATALSNAAYKRSIAEKPCGLNVIYFAIPYNNGEKLMLCGSGQTQFDLVSCNADLSDPELMDFGEMDFGTSYSGDVTNDGGFVEVVNKVSYGDLPDPDPSAEDYDEDLYKSIAEYSLCVVRYAADGTKISDCEIDSSICIGEENTLTGKVIAGEDSVIVKLNGDFIMIDYNGKLLGRIENEKVKSVGKDSDGNFVCTIVPDEGKLKVCTIDPKTAEIQTSDIIYNLTDSLRDSIFVGTGDYSMYISTMKGIYGIRKDDRSIEPVFDYSAASINVNETGDVLFLPNGDIIVLHTDYSSWNTKMRLFTPCDSSEIGETITLTIGRINSDYMLDDYIEELNDSQDEFHIQIKEYSYDDNGEITELAEDIAKGELPDILTLEETGQMSRKYFSDLGCLCDLYEFIDKDEELSRDNFIPNIMKLLETDGKLYSLPNIFCMEGADLIKTKFAGNCGDWTPADRLEFYKNPPEGKKQDKYEVISFWTRFHDICSPFEFIDRETNTCNFNDGVFEDILEYVSQFPETWELDPEIADLNYDDPGWAEYQYYQDSAVRDDRDLVEELWLTSYDGYISTTKGTFGGEPITMLGGKPGVSLTNGSYAINANSPNKELAWEFLREVFTDEFYRNSYKEGTRQWAGLPITISGLEVRAEMDSLPRKNKNGEREDSLYWSCGEERISIGLIEQSDIDAVNEIIFSADKLDNRSEKHLTSAEETIFYEEIDTFIKGGCTAKSCAEMIQNRLSLYLAEQS